MGLVGVQASVLVEKDLGKRELELLVVATVRDQSRKVQTAHPDVAVVLDSERPHPILARVSLSKPLQERMYQRRMPDDLPFQLSQKLSGIHETSYQLPVRLSLPPTATSARFYYVNSLICREFYTENSR